MVAEVMTETLVKEYDIGGYKIGIYTVTIVTTADWVVIDNMEITKYASGYTTADGTDALCYLTASPNTDNKVFFTTTGATTFMVVGTSADSIGGAT